MNSTIAALLVAGTVLVVTNIYWYRRERSLREGLETSRRWDETVAGGDGDDTVDRRLETVANILDTSVEDVPAAVEALDSKVRELQHSVEVIRKTWAGLAADSLSMNSTELEGPLIIHLIDGSGEDAQVLASALERDSLTAIFSHVDAMFVMTAGEATDMSAIDIAQEAMANAPGGAGGSNTFAQGGGSTDCFDAIEAVLDEKADENVMIVSLGGD